MDKLTSEYLLRISAQRTGSNLLCLKELNESKQDNTIFSRTNDSLLYEYLNQI